MKNIFIYVSFASLIFGSNSCDKILQPNIIKTELDTNLYVGNFYNYEFPSFDENTNTLRNVLIEDFTGHKCSYCPGAAIIAHGITVNNPGRVFVAAIHASPSPSGVSSFQKTYVGHFSRDFTTPEGKEIASYLAQGGVYPNPTGTVNRVKNTTGDILVSKNTWAATTSLVLDTPLKVNIQAESNYFSETNGVYIHTESEFLEELEGEYSIVVYAIQNEIIDWQLVGPVEEEFYEHEDVHIGNVYDGEALGRPVASGTISANSKYKTDFSYVIPVELTVSDIHFLIYVYDKKSNEILQVIKHIL